MTKLSDAMIEAGVEELWKLSDTDGDPPSMRRRAEAIYLAMQSAAPQNTDLTDVERDWLIRQLEAWPTRVDPEKTTNIEYLMKKAAALLVSGEGRQDFSRLTLRHNIETILQQWRDAHPNTLLDKIMSAIPRVSNRSGVEILDWLADHSNLELCCAPVEGDLSEEEWQVHRVNGGYNDREWNLVGRGLTPLNALQQARTALDTEKEK